MREAGPGQRAALGTRVRRRSEGGGVVVVRCKVMLVTGFQKFIPTRKSQDIPLRPALHTVPVTHSL